MRSRSENEMKKLQDQEVKFLENSQEILENQEIKISQNFGANDFH